jgi:hypothetical protein
MTWLFNASGGSVAAVALFHASLDIFMMSPVSPHLPGVMGALLTIGSLLVVPKLWARGRRANGARIPRPRTLS